MWTLDCPVPEFEVRCSSGTVGPSYFRGSWFVLLHCSEPIVHDSDACVARFDLLARALAERDCRLLVAIDAPGRALVERLGALAPDRATGLLIGTWLAGTVPPSHGMRFALVDPDGVLRAFEEADRDAFAEWRALDCIACARDARQRHDDRRARDAVGCVDWFDFRATDVPRGPAAPARSKEA